MVRANHTMLIEDNSLQSKTKPSVKPSIQSAMEAVSDLAYPLGPASPSWRCAAVSGSAAPARRRRRQPAPRLDQELVAAQNSLLQRDRAPLTSSHRPFARVSGTRPQYSRICRAHAAKNWCGSTDSGVTTGIEVGRIRHVRLSLRDGWSKCRYGKNQPGQ